MLSCEAATTTTTLDIDIEWTPTWTLSVFLTVRLVREEDWQKTQYTSRLFIEENYSHSPYMRADMRQGIKTTEM